MKIEQISINGKVYSPDSAAINAVDHGLMYGVNAFESLRIHQQKAFLLDEHFDRLERSLSALGIKWDENRKKYFSWIADLCSEMPPDKDAFIRFVVMAGKGEFWVADKAYTSPTIIIYRGNIPVFSPISKQALVLNGIKRIPPEYFKSTGFRIKSMDYSSARIAKLELRKAGQGLDGILLTPEGFIAEGLTSNIFWVKSDKLFTPPLDTGVLSGTMRAYLMSKNKVNEVLASVDELEAADEIFLTSGSSYLNPLSQINHAAKSGINGPVFQKIYKQLLVDIENNSKSLSQPL